MKKILLNNWNIKLMSLFVAIVLWWFVYSEHTPQFRKEMTVPLNYVNINEALARVGGPDVIRLKFRGDTEILNQVSEKNVKAFVDLEGVDEGKRKVEVSIANSTGARVIGRDMSVNVNLKKLNKIEMPVVLHFYGALPIGLKLGQVGRPVSASVYGEPGALSKIKQIQAAIDLTDRNESFSEKVTLRALDRSGVVLNGLNISPSQIEAKVPVVKELESTVKVVLRYRMGAKSGKARYLDYSPRTVTLYGSKYALDRVKSVSTEEFDADRCEEGGFFSLKLETPGNVVASAERVTLSCDPPEEIARSFIVDVAIKGLCKNCRCVGCEKRNERMALNTVIPSGIEVFAVGSSANVNSIMISDITAVADVSGFDPGTHEVEPEVRLKSKRRGVKINSEPPTLRIMIKKDEDLR